MVIDRISVWIYQQCLTPAPIFLRWLFPSFSIPGEFALRIRSSSNSHFHLSGVLQRGELPGPRQNPFAFLGATLVVTPVTIVFHYFLIWKPSTQCSLTFSGYIVTQKCKEKYVKTLKKHTFTEHRLRLLTGPATLSWEALEVDPGQAVALSCWPAFYSRVASSPCTKKPRRDHKTFAV